MRLSKASCNSVSDALIESKPGYSCCIVPLNIYSCVAPILLIILRIIQAIWKNIETGKPKMDDLPIRRGLL